MAWRRRLGAVGNRVLGHGVAAVSVGFGWAVPATHSAKCRGGGDDAAENEIRKSFFRGTPSGFAVYSNGPSSTGQRSDLQLLD
jgi:hypothetical protein